MMIQGLTTSLLIGLSSIANASTYFCENSSIEVQTKETSSPYAQTLIATDKASGEVLFEGNGEAFLGTGLDATFNVPGDAILLISADGSGELTLPAKSYIGLRCVKN